MRTSSTSKWKKRKRIAKRVIANLANERRAAPNHATRMALAAAAVAGAGAGAAAAATKAAKLCLRANAKLRSRRKTATRRLQRPNGPSVKMAKRRAHGGAGVAAE